MSAAATAATARASRAAVGSRMINRIVIYGLLLLFALVYLIPLFVMLVTSFKTMDEIQNGNMLALPQAPTFDPWLRAWGEACVGLTCAGIKGYFWNSIKMVVPAVADLDHARRAERLRADQMALPGRQADLRPDAVRLLHPVPVGAAADGDDPRQVRQLGKYLQQHRRA